MYPIKHGKCKKFVMKIIEEVNPLWAMNKICLFLYESEREFYFIPTYFSDRSENFRFIRALIK